MEYTHNDYLLGYRPTEMLQINDLSLINEAKQAVEAEGKELYVENELLKKYCKSVLKVAQQKINSYLVYGQHWYAMKRVLAEQGFLDPDEVQETEYTTLANLFTRQKPIATMIAGIKYANEVGNNFFLGESTSRIVAIEFTKRGDDEDTRHFDFVVEDLLEF